MNQNLINKVVWAAGTAVVTLILVAAFHIGTNTPIKLGTAGITNLTGLSIIGSSPGTLAVNSGTTLSGGQLNTYAVSTSSTATSQTLIASDVKGYDTVIFTPTVGSDTLTFFASSTATTWLPTAGNTQRTCFINGTTTANIYLTFAGGTGTKLLVASSSATALGAVNLAPQKEGCFTFTRANSTATTFDILASYVAYQ